MTPSTDSNPLEVPWDIKDAAKTIGAVLILFAGLLFFFVAPIAIITGEDSDLTLLAETASIGIWDIGVVYVVYRAVRRAGGSWWHLGFRPPLAPGETVEDATRRGWVSQWGRVFGLSVGGYVVCILIVLVYQLIINLLGIDFLKPEEQLPQEVLDRDWLLPFIGISVLLTAPIAEEILFRGFVFSALRRRLPLLPAALISGILFSMAHIQVGLIIPFMLVGAVLAYFYERNRSIFVNIGIHFIFNFLSFMLLVADATSS